MLFAGTGRREGGKEVLREYWRSEAGTGRRGGGNTGELGAVRVYGCSFGRLHQSVGSVMCVECEVGVNEIGGGETGETGELGAGIVYECRFGRSNQSNG